MFMSKKFFLQIIINFFILVVLVSSVHNNLKNKRVHNFKAIENTVITQDKLYVKIQDNFKLDVSKQLASTETYNKYFNRNCEISSSKEERKRVRWIIPFFSSKIYKELFEIKSTLPFYTHVVFFGFLLFAAYFVLFRTFPVEKEYKFLFLFIIAFIFQNRLGEFTFTIIELFLMSVALYASKYKKFQLFLLTIIIAQLNRESGVIISLTWLIFNKDLKKFILAIIIPILIFIIANYDIAKCLFNYKFFVPLENEMGQFNLSDIGQKTSILASIKIILLNLVIPFSVLFYYYFSLRRKNKIFLYIILTYLFVFLIAVTWSHLSIRMLLLPILISLIYFKKEEKKTNSSNNDIF